MPIISAALIPNSTLLLPKLAPLIQRRLTKTRQAIDRLGHELYARQPTVILMVAYGPPSLKVCNLLQSPKLPYSFTEWGDLTTSGQVLIATGFTHSLKEKAESNFPLLLRSVDQLPVGFALPVSLLSSFFSNLPFSFLELPRSITMEELSHLGAIIKKQCNYSSERVLFIAVGNLAEQLKKTKDEAKVYDKYFQAALRPLNPQLLANLDPDLRKRVKETSWAPTLLGVLVIGEIPSTTELLSYEAPMGVGYMVAQIKWL